MSDDETYTRVWKRTHGNTYVGSMVKTQPLEHLPPRVTIYCVDPVGVEEALDSPDSSPRVEEFDSVSSAIMGGWAFQ